jgi:hypothetical protein
MYRVLQKQTKDWMLKKEYGLECNESGRDGMVSVQLTQNTKQKLDLVNTTMNHIGAKIVAEFFLIIHQILTSQIELDSQILNPYILISLTA